MHLFFLVDVQFLLDGIGEIFLFGDCIFPVSLVPLLITPENLLKIRQHDVHDADCFARIDYVCHRSLLRTHQTGTKTDSQIVRTHLAVLLIRDHVFQQKLN